MEFSMNGCKRGARQSSVCCWDLSPAIIIIFSLANGDHIPYVLPDLGGVGLIAVVATGCMASLLEGPLPNAKVSAPEMESIRKALGDTATPICFGICRVLISTSMNQGWQDLHQWGAACLVMDRARNAKIIRVFDLQTNDVIFDEELYIAMQYTAPRRYFHMFEAQSAVIGLDFVNEDDAISFHSRVASMVPSSTPQESVAAPAAISPATTTTTGFLGKVKGIFSKKEKEMQIGSPSNVVHRHHVGVDPVEGFEIKNLPEEWKELFKASGVRPKDLKDMATANLLFDTISSHLKPEDADGRRPPPAPPLGVPPPPPHRQQVQHAPPTRPPPPQPSRPVRVRRAPQRPHPSGRPAPPPPDRSQTQHIRAAPPRPAVPPPPPPPRTTAQGFYDESYSEEIYEAYQRPVAPPQPPPPPPPASTTATPTSRSALLSQIEAGKALKPVSADTSPRSGLLSQIQAGTTLRPVDTQKEHPDDVVLPDLSSMLDSDKLSMMNHIKTLLDARRDQIDHNEESDEDEAWD